MPSKLPSRERLHLAVRKISGDFLGKVAGVQRVIAEVHEGAPVVVVQATIASPPRNFPRALQLDLGDGSKYNLRIEWRYIAKPSDEQMWGGSSPVEDRPITLVNPTATPGLAPEFKSVQGIPKQNNPDGSQLVVPARLPGFALPNFWARPFEPIASICVPKYETRYTALTYRVSSTKMIIIKGMSYEFNNSINLFDQFEVSISRDSELLTTFSDMKASNAVNPAEQYAFAGHYRPIPLYCRIDHDQTLVVQVRVRGPYPFTKTDVDPLGGCFTVALMGWESTLMDSRDGGARPFDLGDFNDIALG